MLRRAREFVRPKDEAVTATYRVSAGELEPDHWTHDLAEGGGRLLGEGCHFVDALAYLAGSPVESVFCAARGSGDTPLQARDDAAIVLTFQNGSVGSLVYSAEGSPRLAKERVEVFSGPRSAVLDDYRSLQLHGANGKQELAERTQDKGHAAEIAAFLEGIARGEPPVSLQEVYNVSAASLAVVESLRTGLPVRLARNPD